MQLYMQLVWYNPVKTYDLLVCGASLPKRDRVFFAEYRQQLLKKEVASRVQENCLNSATVLSENRHFTLMCVMTDE